MDKVDRFYFCDQDRIMFTIDAVDGQLPVEHAAALLAMHCYVRNLPVDRYKVLIDQPELMKAVHARAADLIHEAPASDSVYLTTRQEQVLRGLLRGLANKEIAAEINIAERTVKFHMSDLFRKYHVDSRMDLVRLVRDTYR